AAAGGAGKPDRGAAADLLRPAAHLVHVLPTEGALRSPRGALRQGAVAILRVERLSRHFGGLKAVNEATFAVEPHTITSLMGPNGAGKTTVFNLVTGLLPPSGGTIWYRERQLTGLGPDAIARLGMGRTFQEPRVFGEMTVLDNVLVGCARQTGEGL